MSTYETLLVDRDGAVAILTINRPEKRNALSGQVRADLIAALDDLRDDDSVRVLVITGAGDKAFVAGADIAEFADRTPLEQRAVMTGRRVFDEIAAYPKPVIAMINGFCLGGGCELALGCDVRIAADSARFGQPEINLGIIPGGGGTQRLPRVVGMGQAMRLVLSGELIDAAEALRIGLADVVHPAADLRERTLEFARGMAAKSPVALRMAKSAVRAAAEMPLAAGLQYETELFVTCFASDDKREGVAAFLEKRAAEFTGR
ncbi:enoyl-CoA hydratase-related protein [Longimicrobium terrae]|uniref:Enoyl-CoA hydratase n=1 Tax=Longimicrobium terrae TaxID=1639882 RepID=A0A841H5G5_9BACT|nr:enoyl-CoA hydratase [Longimicrobium terrae]MBB6072999.1 enoyl-CoA hydratase [Longimicrobium terrae]